MKNSIEHLKKEFDVLVEYIEGTLTSEERKQLNQSIVKIKAGDASDFVLWKNVKSE